MNSINTAEEFLFGPGKSPVCDAIPEIVPCVAAAPTVQLPTVPSGGPSLNERRAKFEATLARAMSMLNPTDPPAVEDRPAPPSRSIERRLLTVERDSAKFKPAKTVSKLRLKGQWLNTFGFPPGSLVSVVPIAPGKLEITLLAGKTAAGTKPQSP